MKHKFLFLAVLLSTLFTTSLWAQTPGYAIFGETPDGYTPLQSAVNIVGAGSYSDKFVVEDGVLKITGNTSLSTTRVCSDESNNIRLQFTSAQTLTLTSNLAIHIKVKKGSTNSNANLHFALCRDGWNSKRLGYFIPQSGISDSEETEIVLKYGDRATSDWSSANETQMYGTNISFSANDIVRFQAQTNDYFEISQIYIEAEYEEPLTPQDPKRYYFVRSGDLPVIAGIECVDLRATEHAAWSANPSSVAPNLSGDYAAFALPNQWFAVDFRPNAQCMADVRKADWYLRMKIRTDATALAGQNLRINLSNGAANFFLTNEYGDGEWHDVTFALADAANTLRSFPVSANDIAFQLHANSSLSGTYFYIEYAYLTNDPLTDEKPAIVDNVAPANFSVTEKAGATNHNSTTLQLYAEDEDTPITYTISYKVKGSADEPIETSVNGAQGTTVEKLITGLAPETTYTFSVIASDPNGNETAPEELDIITTAMSEHRFYLVRGDNSEPLPSSASLTSTLVNCNVEFGNSARDARISDYVSLVTGNTWMAVTFKPTAAVANTINDEWYIVVRMRNSLTNSFDFNRFRLNLVNNGQNWYINNSDSDKPFGHDYNDNGWVTITKKIGDRRSGTGVPSSFLATGEVAAQLHVDNNLEAGEYFDIDYIYFTDDITSLDPGTQTGKKIVIKEGEDNAAVLTVNDGQTVDVYLRRTLSSASFNTFCVPFDMSAAEVEETFGAGVVIGRLGDARIKDDDELYLGFEFVEALEAGVPYIIQPLANVANPLLFDKTIDKDEHPTEIGDVSFKGVFSPYAIPQQSAENHTILLLGAENTLSWPNASHNMKGMRAYFETTSTVAHVARRARFGFEGEQTTTGINQIENGKCENEKMIIDGQLVIIREGVKYNALGQTIK